MQSFVVVFMRTHSTGIDIEYESESTEDGKWINVLFSSFKDAVERVQSIEKAEEKFYRKPVVIKYELVQHFTDDLDKLFDKFETYYKSKLRTTRISEHLCTR